MWCVVDDELSEIMDIVDTIKSNPKERRRYMGLMGVIEYERRDAYEEGRKEGHESGYQSGHESGYQSGHEEGQVAGAISTCKFVKLDRESAKKAIMEQFVLASDDAEQYMKRYWDEADK